MLLTRFRGLFDREPAPRGPTCDLDGPACGSTPVGRFDPSHRQRRELQRWNVEVTFEEVRAHLGLETQRQWTTRAVGRTTPCLLGLFSLVVLMAYTLHPNDLPTRHAAWYAKPEATFIDALAAVRRQLWANRNWPSPRWQVGMANPPAQFLSLLVDAACYAA